MNDRPQITIGIPVYNGREELQKCLKSIQDELTGMDLEVIVVQDGKSEYSNEKMIREEFPWVRYLYDKDTFGIPANTEKIITLMQGEYLLRLDADTIVNREAVEKMLKMMQSDSSIGVLGPRLVDIDGNFQPSCENHVKKPWEWFWDYALWLKKIHRRIPSSGSEPYAVSGSEPYKVAYMASAAVMIRKEAIDQVGGVDPEMDFFMEDADWILRIGKADWKILYWPKISIIHIGGQSGELYIHTRNRSLRNLYYFYAKHLPGKINQLQLFLAIISGSILSLTFALLFLPFSLIKPKWRKIDQRALKSFVNVFRWHLRKHDRSSTTQLSQFISKDKDSH